MGTELFEAIGACSFCDDYCRIAAIGKKGICAGCFSALADLLEKWQSG